MSARPKRLLIIAGSDSSGGAGIQADIKTADAFGVYAMTAITAVTAQNTKGVAAVQAMKPDLVAAQIQACLTDIGADAIKIGMLASAPVVKAVAAAIAKAAKTIPVVLDPVMVSTGGSELLNRAGVAALKKHLFPLASIVTPNIPEAKALVGLKSSRNTDVERAARDLMTLGAHAALIKGGHATRLTVDDVLLWEGGLEVLGFPRIKTRHTHGTGCTYATAIACGLAQDLSMPLAVGRAREYVQVAIATAPGFGKGHGPLNHFARGGQDNTSPAF